jgi:glutathione peroxidase
MYSLSFKIATFLLIALVALIAYSFVPHKKKIVSSGKTIYDFRIRTLEGEEITLEKFKGKKMLIVNVASECGYTPQYKNLEALYEKYREKVTVIGFPANNFGGQEPGDSKQIREFCTKNYGVSFPMMEKISVKGDDVHPLYHWLSHKEENGTCDEAPKWNFAKYLVDENGIVIRFFGHKVDPLSDEIVSLL